jgi:serine/threonine protein kinase
MVQACRRCGQVHEAYAACVQAVPARATLVGADEALVGNIIADRYEVVDVLGKGATGTVFDVKHASFVRHAAMKIVRPRFADAELVSRVFHGEARAAWSVAHPSLTEVFDIGALPDGTPFFVMEKLDGETLATRIRRDRLSIGAAVDVAMQLLSAIAAIHTRDLLLRDLRPQNVFLAYRRGCRPVAKILDFGLARLTPLEQLTKEWEALRASAGVADAGGSTAIPFYLSPERTRSENGIEPASDLFVLGVILYEALTGQRPFGGATLEGVLREIQHGRPKPISECRADVPGELSQFVMRTLSPNPRQRPSSAKEMQDELRAIFEARRNPSPLHAAGTLPSAMTPSGGIPIVPLPPPAQPAHPSAVSPLARTAPSTRRGMPFEDPEDPYEETQTKRDDLIPKLAPDSLTDDELSTAARRFAIGQVEQIALPKLHGIAYGDPGDESSTASSRLQAYALDEASADNSDRTVPPPRPDASIDVSFEEAVDRTVELLENGVSRQAIGIGASGNEEEETETMELTPELRARVEQLMAIKPAPRGVGQPPAAPPTPTGPRGRKR